MVVCASPLCAAQCARTADPAWHAPLPPQAHQSRRPLAPAAVTHPTQPRSHCGLPAARHSPTIWRRGPSCAASYIASCSARIAQPKPAQPARHPAQRLCGTRTRPLASAAPLPLRPRRSCATAAPLLRRHRDFPCCLRTDKGAGLAWQCVSGELQRGRERGRVRGRG